MKKRSVEKSFNFLDEEFVTLFFRLNLSKVNLSKYKLLSCKIIPLKLSKTGRKSVVEFKLELGPIGSGKPTSKSIIGIFRRDSRNERGFDLLQKLRLAGFDTDDNLRVCEPLAYFDDWNLLLTSKAPGLELEQILAEDHHDLFAPSVQNTAKWLAKLHSSIATIDTVNSPNNDRKVLRSWSGHLSQLYPHSAKRLLSLTQQILGIEKSFIHRRFVLVHGDFHPENIFVDGDVVTVTDFERSRVSDPAEDVGYFLGQLTMKAERGKYPMMLKNDDALREVFLKEYGKNASRDTLERVAAYEAKTYVEILHYIYWGLGVKLDPVDFESWTTRAERCLQAYDEQCELIRR